MNSINIVNAADAAYVPHTAAMLHSLFERNPNEKFSIYFLHRPDLENDLIRRLADLCDKFGAGFSAIAVERQRLSEFPLDGIYPEEAWYRLILPQLLPELDRVLWLDSDVIVLQSIQELWQTDLEGQPLAACPNAALFFMADIVAGIGITDRRLYFNTGVLLLNLKQMREEKSGDMLRVAAQRVKKWIKFADQDVLNSAYHHRYKRLQLAWNVLTHSYINVPETIRVHGRAEYKAAMKHPKIVHFTGAAWIKPWSYRWGHPHANAYFRHRMGAGWPLPRPTESGLKYAILRRVPLRAHAILTALKNGGYAEMMSYIRPW